ncbi:NETI motif-containing protein [Paraliobacillus salinarum]|uniref:NETI motif-containing protein n=1 Tax=Paraliobacillus salinarum TaxID=1158996 RepID=UPI0015F4EACB|nr:NETI motif-containing protein [Paraliobacillus salinarum]
MSKSKKKQNKQPNKLRFIVQENETIEACLDRIKEAGYQPVRRTEKPIFKECQSGVEPVASEIVFDTVLAKNEQ